MALHAVQNIGTAGTATREFLLPFDVRQWLKLAVVVFFIGGGMSIPTTQFNTTDVPERVPENEIPFSVPADGMTVIVAVVAVAVMLALVFSILGAIMEFVFVESLRNRTVSIRSDWRNRWRQGLRLFGFRIAIGIPALAVFLGWMALFFAPLIVEGSDPIISLPVFLVGVPLLFVVGLVYGLVSAFTTVFVVPIMIKTDTGVLASWQRLWPSIKTEWRQYLAYAVVGSVLTFATGLLASIVVGLAAIVLLVPLAIVAIVVHLSISLSSTIGLAVLAFLVVLFVVTMVVVWALVRVPILTYLRYYALLVLGDIDTSFDSIPEQRETLRE